MPILKCLFVCIVLAALSLGCSEESAMEVSKQVKSNVPTIPPVEEEPEVVETTSEPMDWNAYSDQLLKDFSGTYGQLGERVGSVNVMEGQFYYGESTQFLVQIPCAFSRKHGRLTYIYEKKDAEREVVWHGLMSEIYHELFEDGATGLDVAITFSETTKQGACHKLVALHDFSNKQDNVLWEIEGYNMLNCGADISTAPFQTGDIIKDWPTVEFSYRKGDAALEIMVIQDIVEYGGGNNITSITDSANILKIESMYEFNGGAVKILAG